MERMNGFIPYLRSSWWQKKNVQSWKIWVLYDIDWLENTCINTCHLCWTKNVIDHSKNHLYFSPTWWRGIWKHQRIWWSDFEDTYPPIRFYFCKRAFVSSLDMQCLENPIIKFSGVSRFRVIMRVKSAGGFLKDQLHLWFNKDDKAFKPLKISHGSIKPHFWRKNHKRWLFFPNAPPVKI